MIMKLIMYTIRYLSCSADVTVVLSEKHYLILRIQTCTCFKITKFPQTLVKHMRALV